MNQELGAVERGSRRPRHVDLANTPYFVSTRLASSRSIFAGDIAGAAQEQLLADRDRYGFKLLAYAFMPDHAHFVIVPAEGRTISATMRVLKGSIARRVNQISGGTGTVWQEGFFDEVAHTLEQLNAYIEYTHGNPECMRQYQEFLNEA